MRCLIALLCAMSAVAADQHPVVAVAGPDRVIVDYRGLRVALPLALVTVPDAQRDQATARLRELAVGKRVEVAALGQDGDGLSQVVITAGKTSLNESLVAAGLADYQPAAPEPPLGKVLAKARDAARKAGAGMWAGTAAAEAPAKPAAAKASAKPATGPFVSELDSRIYYPAGAPELAQVDPRRLISYASEAAAEKAGKRRANTVQIPAGDGSEAHADAVLVAGEAIYARAIDAGNTPLRDQLYEQAGTVLAKAVELFSVLAEGRPDDEALGEKLRKASQLRYGSIKQRRFK